jgi:hypothetical protein
MMIECRATFTAANWRFSSGLHRYNLTTGRGSGFVGHGLAQDEIPGERFRRWLGAGLTRGPCVTRISPLARLSKVAIRVGQSHPLDSRSRQTFVESLDHARGSASFRSHRFLAEKQPDKRHGHRQWFS